MKFEDHTRKEWSDLHKTKGGGKMLTKQADKDAADINIIVANYGTTGAFSRVNPIEPRYQDNTAVTDLIEARNTWNAAVEQFQTLPADVRAMAHNDPVVFMRMMTEEESVARLKAAGLPLKETPAPSRTETLLEELVKNTAPKVG